jgi:putative tryptophan/tyrosine transport system substrate-binding protein
LRRREFVVTLGAAALPLAGYAQQPEGVRRVGVLNAFPENDPVNRATLTAFASALERLGWVEGQNIRIDYRVAAGDPALFKTYAAELVGLSPDAILASNTPAVAAVRQQTRTAPIVFVRVSDPIGQGVVGASRDPAATSRGSAFTTPR